MRVIIIRTLRLEACFLAEARCPHVFERLLTRGSSAAPFWKTPHLVRTARSEAPRMYKTFHPHVSPQLTVTMLHDRNDCTAPLKTYLYILSPKILSTLCLHPFRAVQEQQRQSSSPHAPLSLAQHSGNRTDINMSSTRVRSTVVLFTLAVLAVCVQAKQPFGGPCS